MGGLGNTSGGFTFPTFGMPPPMMNPLTEPVGSSLGAFPSGGIGSQFDNVVLTQPGHQMQIDVNSILGMPGGNPSGGTSTAAGSTSSNLASSQYCSTTRFPFLETLNLPY